jgi:phosphoribosyl-ATP pyrophosphohydrolase
LARPSLAKLRPPPDPRASLIGEAVALLEQDLLRVREQPGRAPRTAKLLDEGVPKKAKKVGEEAVELALDAVAGERGAVIGETADLVYHLVVLLDALGIGWDEVAAELGRRRDRFGVAEKLPKAPAEPVP